MVPIGWPLRLWAEAGRGAVRRVSSSSTSGMKLRLQSNSPGSQAGCMAQVTSPWPRCRASPRRLRGSTRKRASRPRRCARASPTSRCRPPSTDSSWTSAQGISVLASTSTTNSAAQAGAAQSSHAAIASFKPMALKEMIASAHDSQRRAANLGRGQSIVIRRTAPGRTTMVGGHQNKTTNSGSPMSVKQADTQLQGITDLCLITAVKPAFVSAFETITHVERLRRVLKTLNSLRQAARESSDPPSPDQAFTAVGRSFRSVPSFRWVIIDPKPGSTAPAQLLLNVCFDGGWEPYMRVIWDELGSMLDLILCHCEGYPLARENSFDRYIDWVRRHELASDFLYLESGRSSSDHEYLALLEAAQRRKPANAALAATRLSSPHAGETKPLPSHAPERYQMALRGLPALAALHSLDRYFLP